MLWKADPTFYPSPKLAARGPRETLAYVAALNANGSNQPDALPVLKRVVVFHGGTVGLGTTLQEAIVNSFGGQIPTGGGGGGHQAAGGNTSQQIQALLTAALQHFSKANTALQAGDLGTYQTELKRAQDLVRQASDLAAKLKSGGGGSSSGTPLPSFTPSPSATPTPSATPSP